jgi:hypothetical protein
MDVPEVRRRLRAAIANARTAAQERRTRADLAARAYETFLTTRAVPVFHTFASALVAEGLRFKVFTPAGSVRLASEGGAEDYIELTLDSSGDIPHVLGRTSRGRGRQLVTSERVLREGTDIGELTEEDVLDYLAAEIGPFVTK